MIKKKKKDSELEQVNGECSSERRLMSTAGRSHKSKKWIMIMPASHTWNTSPSWKEVQNTNPRLSKGQSITCLTIYQILFLAGRVKERATFWFTSAAGLHCNFHRVFTKEGIIKGITRQTWPTTVGNAYQLLGHSHLDFEEGCKRWEINTHTHARMYTCTRADT